MEANEYLMNQEYLIESIQKVYPYGYDKQVNRYINAIKRFKELYGNQEIHLFSAPGRSEIGGNHTDHQHGCVLAAAIDLDMIGVVSKSDTIEITSNQMVIETIRLDDITYSEKEKNTSKSIVKGILNRFKQLGFQVGGFNAYLTSDVLQGSGLSSSAAFEVMIGTILNGLYNDSKIDPVLIAQIGQYAENTFFGKPSGLMDQCASSLGGLVYIDFNDPTQPIVEKLEIDFKTFGYQLCIVDTHASHADLTDDYTAITQELKVLSNTLGVNVLREANEALFYGQIGKLRSLNNDRMLLRAIHFFEENKRPLQLVKALKENDLIQFLDLINQSGNSSYKYLQNIYTPSKPTHQAVALALAVSEHILKDKGVVRVHGGGFAGTIQAFVKEDFVKEYKKQIEATFGEGSCLVLNIRKQGGIQII